MAVIFTLNAQVVGCMLGATLQEEGLHLKSLASTTSTSNNNNTRLPSTLTMVSVFFPHLSELHLVHALSSVPMQESLATEHGRKLLTDTFE